MNSAGQSRTASRWHDSFDEWPPRRKYLYVRSWPTAVILAHWHDLPYRPNGVHLPHNFLRYPRRMLLLKGVVIVGALCHERSMTLALVEGSELVHSPGRRRTFFPIFFSVARCRESCDKFVDCRERLWGRVGIELCRQSLSPLCRCIQRGAGVCKNAAAGFLFVFARQLPGLGLVVVPHQCVSPSEGLRRNGSAPYRPCR